MPTNTHIPMNYSEIEMYRRQISGELLAAARRLDKKTHDAQTRRLMSLGRIEGRRYEYDMARIGE